MLNNHDVTKDIAKATDELMGWENLEIQAIEKFGKELSIKTNEGEVFVSARSFFQQYEFRIKVFEDLGVVLYPVKSKKYQQWLEYWASTITKNLRLDDADIADTAEKMIKEYLEETQETDVRYVRMGRPVLSDGKVLFRSKDIINKLKNENVTVTNDQVYFILRRIGCKTRVVDNKTLRVWSWKVPDPDIPVKW